MDMQREFDLPPVTKKLVQEFGSHFLVPVLWWA